MQIKVVGHAIGDGLDLGGEIDMDTKTPSSRLLHTTKAAVDSVGLAVGEGTDNGPTTLEKRPRKNELTVCTQQDSSDCQNATSGKPYIQDLSNAVQCLANPMGAWNYWMNGEGGPGASDFCAAWQNSEANIYSTCGCGTLARDGVHLPDGGVVGLDGGCAGPPVFSGTCPPPKMCMKQSRSRRGVVQFDDCTSSDGGDEAGDGGDDAGRRR
jgi:hypothetical protein